MSAEDAVLIISRMIDDAVFYEFNLSEIEALQIAVVALGDKVLKEEEEAAK